MNLNWLELLAFIFIGRYLFGCFRQRPQRKIIQISERHWHLAKHFLTFNMKIYNLCNRLQTTELEFQSDSKLKFKWCQILLLPVSMVISSVLVYRIIVSQFTCRIIIEKDLIWWKFELHFVQMAVLIYCQWSWRLCLLLRLYKDQNNNRLEIRMKQLKVRYLLKN